MGPWPWRDPTAICTQRAAARRNRITVCDSGRIGRIDGIDASTAALIKLSDPVDFDAGDGEPVDLVFGMMVPTDINASHQENIRSIAKLLDDPELRRKMRAANSSSELYESLIDSSVSTVVMDLKVADGS